MGYKPACGSPSLYKQPRSRGHAVYLYGLVMHDGIPNQSFWEEMFTNHQQLTIVFLFMVQAALAKQMWIKSLNPCDDCKHSSELGRQQEPFNLLVRTILDHSPHHASRLNRTHNQGTLTYVSNVQVYKMRIINGEGYCSEVTVALSRKQGLQDQATSTVGLSDGFGCVDERTDSG